MAVFPRRKRHLPLHYNTSGTSVRPPATPSAPIILRDDLTGAWLALRGHAAGLRGSAPAPEAGRATVAPGRSPAHPNATPTPTRDAGTLVQLRQRVRLVCVEQG